MAADPITIRSFRTNREALQAQEYLKQHEVASYIFLESSWVKGDGTPKVDQNILLVTLPRDAERASNLLKQHTQSATTSSAKTPALASGTFFRRAGWMLVVFFVFYFVSSFRDGMIDGFELVPAGIFLTAAAFFFALALLPLKKPGSSSHQPV